MRAQIPRPPGQTKKGHKTSLSSIRSQRQKCPRSLKSYSIAGAYLRPSHRNSESHHAEYYESQSGGSRRKPPPSLRLSPLLRRTGCSTVHHEAAASLFALCPRNPFASRVLAGRPCPALRTAEVAIGKSPPRSSLSAKQLSSGQAPRSSLSAPPQEYTRSSHWDFSCGLTCQTAIALRTFHAVSGASTRTENWDLGGQTLWLSQL